MGKFENEALLRGKIGETPGSPTKEPAHSETSENKYDIIEPETEYAQIMRINIEHKFDKSME